MCIKELDFPKENGIVMLLFPPHCIHVCNRWIDLYRDHLKSILIQRLINGILIKPVKE